MARKETDKQYNITLSEASSEKLETFMTVNGISRNAALTQAVDMLKVDGLKEAAPDQKAAIEDFQLYINKLLAAFSASIERSLTADERARFEVRSQLDGIATLTETNSRLEREKTELQEETAKLEAVVADQKATIKKLEEKVAGITADAAEIEKLKRQCSNLTQEKADLLAQHNAEIAKMQKENFAKILEVIKAGTK